jgi:glycosyltransferase involved in cell wall biosynthesis
MWGKVEMAVRNPTEERRRLLMVGSFAPGPGVNPAVGETLAAKLMEQGHSVIQVSRERSRMAKLWDMVATAWKERRRYECAYVEVYSGAAFLWAEAVTLALRLARKPYVLALHGGNLPRFLQRRPARARRLLSSGNRVVAPSKYLASQLRPHRPDIRLIPNGLDLANYPYRQRVRVRPRLVWLRAFHSIYHPLMAVEILRILAGEFDDATLLMLGPAKTPKVLQDCIAAAERYGISRQVHFGGAVMKADVGRWLQQGDIFLNTTNYDNAPVTLMEAMACGLPVVTTDAGGVPYIVEHERNGLLSGRRDAPAMSANVRRLLLENGLAARLSAAGREFAESLDWAKILPRWEDVFQDLARQA